VGDLSPRYRCRCSRTTPAECLVKTQTAETRYRSGSNACRVLARLAGAEPLHHENGGCKLAPPAVQQRHPTDEVLPLWPAIVIGQQALYLLEGQVSKKNCCNGLGREITSNPQNPMRTQTTADTRQFELKPSTAIASQIPVEFGSQL
jgi:hypothetical protein